MSDQAPLGKRRRGTTINAACEVNAKRSCHDLGYSDLPFGSDSPDLESDPQNTPEADPDAVVCPYSPASSTSSKPSTVGSKSEQDCTTRYNWEVDQLSHRVRALSLRSPSTTESRLRQLSQRGHGSEPPEPQSKHPLEAFLADHYGRPCVTHWSRAANIRIFGIRTISYAMDISEAYPMVTVTTTDLDIGFDDDLPAEDERYDTIILIDPDLWLRDLGRDLGWCENQLKCPGSIEIHGLNDISLNSPAETLWRKTQSLKKAEFQRDLTLKTDNWFLALQRSLPGFVVTSKLFSRRPSWFGPEADDELTMLCREHLAHRTRMEVQISRWRADEDDLIQDALHALEYEGLEGWIQYYVCMAQKTEVVHTSTALKVQTGMQ